MSEIIVLSLNQEVTIGLGGDRFPATIIGIALYCGRIQYQVVWWDNRTRKSEWLDDVEISTDGKNKTKIGFKK
jgi:hypothetical protein